MINAMAATWPPAAWHESGPFVIGEGQGGGQRVASARVTGASADWHADIAKACAHMRDLGQAPLFQLQEGVDDSCDKALAAQGFAIGDTVALLALPLERDMVLPAKVSAHWPPDAAQQALWQAAGVGPARLAVMARAPNPTSLAVVAQGACLGTAFLAQQGAIACLHALEVAPLARRQGLGRALTLAAAALAARQGASHLALLVLANNAPALALYEGLGFSRVSSMHYRHEARP